MSPILNLNQAFIITNIRKECSQQELYLLISAFLAILSIIYKIFYIRLLKNNNLFCRYTNFNIKNN